MRGRLIQELVGSLVPVPAPLRRVLHRGHATQGRRSPCVAQRQGESAPAPRQLERVRLLLRRDLRRHDPGDVPGPGIAVRPAVRSRGARAAMSRQGRNAPRLQHPQQDADRRRLPAHPRGAHCARRRLVDGCGGRRPAAGGAAVVPVDGIRGGRARGVSDLEVRLPDVDDLVRQTRHRSADRHLRLLPTAAQRA